MADEQQKDDFEDAFEEATAPEPESKEPEPKEPEPEPKEPEPKEPDPVPEPEPKEPGPEPKEPEPKEPEPQQQDSGEPDDDPVALQQQRSWEGRLRAQEQRLREREAALQEEAERLKAQAEAVAATTNDDPPASMTLERWQTIQQDYPDIAEGVNEMVDARVKEALEKANAAIDERTAPILQGQQALTQEQREIAAREHFARIETAHPDYRKIVQGGDLETYVNEQPSFVSESMRNVIEQGTTEQVIDLLQSYKRARGLDTQPSPQTTTPASSQAGDVPTAVPSRGGGIPERKAPAEDFDGAFDEALKT